LCGSAATERGNKNGCILKREFFSDKIHIIYSNKRRFYMPALLTIDLDYKKDLSLLGPLSKSLKDPMDAVGSKLTLKELSENANNENSLKIAAWLLAILQYRLYEEKESLHYAEIIGYLLKVGTKIEPSTNINFPSNEKNQKIRTVNLPEFTKQEAADIVIHFDEVALKDEQRCLLLRNEDDELSFIATRALNGFSSLNDSSRLLLLKNLFIAFHDKPEYLEEIVFKNQQINKFLKAQQKENNWNHSWESLAKANSSICLLLLEKGYFHTQEVSKDNNIILGAKKYLNKVSNEYLMDEANTDKLSLLAKTVHEDNWTDFIVSRHEKQMDVTKLLKISSPICNDNITKIFNLSPILAIKCLPPEKTSILIKEWLDKESWLKVKVEEKEHPLFTYATHLEKNNNIFAALQCFNLYLSMKEKDEKELIYLGNYIEELQKKSINKISKELTYFTSDLDKFENLDQKAKEKFEKRLRNFSNILKVQSNEELQELKLEAKKPDTFYTQNTYSTAMDSLNLDDIHILNEYYKKQVIEKIKLQLTDLDSKLKKLELQKNTQTNEEVKGPWAFGLGFNKN
jgi:hypothetical protein